MSTDWDPLFLHRWLIPRLTSPNTEDHNNFTSLTSCAPVRAQRETRPADNYSEALRQGMRMMRRSTGTPDFIFSLMKCHPSLFLPFLVWIVVFRDFNSKKQTLPETPPSHHIMSTSKPRGLRLLTPSHLQVSRSPRQLSPESQFQLSATRISEEGHPVGWGHKEPKAIS